MHIQLLENNNRWIPNCRIHTDGISAALRLSLIPIKSQGSWQVHTQLYKN